jgi:hypothetical protein
MIKIVSLLLFAGALLPSIIHYAWLKLYGLDGVVIVGLLFFGIALFAINLELSGSDAESPGQYKLFARNLAITLLLLLPMMAISYGIRRGIRFTMRRIEFLNDDMFDNLEYLAFMLAHGLLFYGFYLGTEYYRRKRGKAPRKHW